MTNQKGFTIIEMAVALAIMIIVSGFAVPVYLNLKPTVRINGAARQVMGDLMWARMRSVSENNDYIITFGTSTNTYNIYDDDNNNFAAPNIDANELVKAVSISDEYKGIGYGFVPGMNDVSGNVLLPGSNTVTFSQASGVVWFRFEPNGRSNKNGSIYLIPNEDISSGRENRARVVSVIQTGRVKIRTYDSASNSWN